MRSGPPWLITAMRLAVVIRSISSAARAVAFGFTFRRSSTPGVGRPLIAEYSRDLVPFESFPRTEIEFLQSRFHSHFTAIAPAERECEPVTALCRAAHHTVDRWSLREGALDVFGRAVRQRHIQAPIARAGCDIAPSVSDQNEFHAASNAR